MGRKILNGIPLFWQFTSDEKKIRLIFAKDMQKKRIQNKILRHFVHELLSFGNLQNPHLVKFVF